MKNIHLLDIIFILVSCAVLVLVDYLGYSEVFARFSYLILIIGYFSGKLISGYYQNTKLRKDTKI